MWMNHENTMQDKRRQTQKTIRFLFHLYINPDGIGKFQEIESGLMTARV